MNTASGVAHGHPFDLKATIYCYDEHGFEILKENTVLRIPMFLQHLSNFKQFVFEFAGIASILEEVGFRDYDILLYRLTSDNERFVIRTQHQYNLEKLKFFSNASDRLEVMICKKMIACVKGRPGSILIVPTDPGVTSSHRKSHVKNPEYFRRDDQPNESSHPNTSPEPTSLPLPTPSGVFPMRKRKKGPKKEEDETLFEQIRRTDFVERNQRQQAIFDDLATLLKDLNGSVPVSEGKFICGICKKERLVCPNRNNVGRVRYFRRKHYDKCLSTDGKGNYRGGKTLSDFGLLPFGSDGAFTDDYTRQGSSRSEEGRARTDRGTPSRETSPRGDHSIVMRTCDTGDGDVETVYVKQETLADITQEHMAEKEHYSKDTNII